MSETPDPIQITATQLAQGTGMTREDWALPVDAEAYIFADGTVNALLDDGTTVYDLTAGNDEAKAQVVELYRSLS